MENFWMFFKLIIYIPFILFLIYASLKFGGKRLQSIQNGNYIKIIEKVQTSKETSIILAEIGTIGYVMSVTNHGIEVIKELKDVELQNLKSKKMIKEYNSFKDLFIDINKAIITTKGSLKGPGKIKVKKEENNE